MKYEVMEQDALGGQEEADGLKKKKEKKPFRMKGFLKKLPVKKILLVGVILAVGGYFAVRALTPPPEMIVPHRVVTLAPQDLRNTVDVTGNVESETKSSVYSTLTYPITEVAVEVGDRVEEGQLLCRLDTDTLEAEIKAKEAGVWTSASNNNLSIQQAQDNLATARAYYDKGEDAAILSALSALESAERSLRSAEFDVRTAERNLSNARRENKDAEDDGDDPIFDEYDLDGLRNAVSKAYLSQEAAETAVAEAQQKLSRAENDAKDEIKRLEEAVTKAKNSANQTADYISLDSLRENLEKCTIISPAFGTVTAVYAREGNAGNGLLFVVEEPDALIVESTVMEYDVNNVKPGQKVEIKSDATGEEIFLGEVLSVSPASVKDTSGKTVTGSTASFEMKIKVLDKDSGLRIGMNVRASIITEEKPQSTAVLYDAVGVHPETGEPVVFVADPIQMETPEGEVYTGPTHKARMVTVTTGMETDLYWEINSPDLTEGDLILQDAESLVDGMEIHISDPNNPYGVSDMGEMGGGMPGGRGGVAVRMR